MRVGMTWPHPLSSQLLIPAPPKERHELLSVNSAGLKWNSLTTMQVRLHARARMQMRSAHRLAC